MSKGSGEGEGRRKVLGRRGGHISSKKSKGKGGGRKGWVCRRVH